MGPHVPPLSCLPSSPGLGRPPCCLLVFGCARSSLGVPGLFVAARGLPLVVASRGYSLDLVPGLLFAVASLAMEHGI